MPNLDAVIAGLVRGRQVDLAVWTGDYRWRVHGAHEQVIAGNGRNRCGDLGVRRSLRDARQP